MPRKKSKMTPPTRESVRAAIVTDLSQFVTVKLTLAHCINGVKMGPGKVTVPKDTASVLLEQERNYTEAEQRLHDAGASLIGARGRLIAVNPDFFDASLATAPLAARVERAEWR